MADMSSQIAVSVAIISAAAVVISAIVTGISQWMISRRASKSRIAEYRKEWIENLRTRISEYMSDCHRLGNIRREYEHSLENNVNKSEHLHKSIRQETRNCSFLLNQIRLNLNTKETRHKSLDKLLVNLLRESQGQIPEDRDLNELIVQTTRPILKDEWDRLKTEMQHKR